MGMNVHLYTPTTLSPQMNPLLLILNGKLGGPPSRRVGKERNLLFLSRIEPQFFNRPARQPRHSKSYALPASVTIKYRLKSSTLVVVKLKLLINNQGIETRRSASRSDS
jgi:hypothetical protein